MNYSQRLIYNKLISGSFRVGVSQILVVRALSQISEIPSDIVAHRLMGEWTAERGILRAPFKSGTRVRRNAGRASVSVSSGAPD